MDGRVSSGSAGAGPGTSPPSAATPPESPPPSVAEPPTSSSSDGRRRGRCKWFNVAKGWGFITPDDGGQDVFVHQSVIRMAGFRSLGDDEEVEFECAVSGKGLEATAVTGPRGAACCGSHRRPAARRRFRKIRCYNCGEFANHIAAKCTMGPQPKRCHHCKSEDHLIADCPTRPERIKKNSTSGASGTTPGGDNDTSPSVTPATESVDSGTPTAAAPPITASSSSPTNADNNGHSDE